MTRASKGFVLSRKQEYIEEIGSIDEHIEELTLRREKLISKLQKYPGRSLGLTFQSNVYTRMHTSLNTVKIKRLLGPVKYASCLRRKEITVVLVRRI
jgi:hypothetical protein